MRHNFPLTFALVVATLGLSCSEAGAQIVTISSSGYQALPNRAQPKGTVSWAAPPAGTAYDLRLRHDYGSITGGSFTADANIHVGGVHWSKNVNAAGNDSWAVAGVDNLLLANPIPNNVYIRARLQRHNGMGVYTDLATAYIQIP